MPDDAASLAAECAEARAEIDRLTKIVGVLMDRAERGAGAAQSEFSLFQTAAILEEEVDRRTAELQAALVENSRISRALRKQAETEQRMLRESEQRLDALLHNSSDMITVVAIDGTVLYQAGSVRSVLGYDASELVGANLTDWIDPADTTVLLGLLDTRDAIGAPVRFRHADGSLRVCEVRSTCLLDHPAWAGIVLNIRDVSVSRRLESQLALAHKLESVGQLAAGVAHEINTPVQFVSNSVTFLKRSADKLLTLTSVYHQLLLSDQPIGEEERQRRAILAEDEADLDYLVERVPPAFERALEGIERVATIVRAMRDFSHHSTDRAPINVNDGIRSTVIVAKNEYKYVADIELDLDDVPLVLANGGDLNQVFLNLIVNASHAIETRVADSDQRGTITVRTRAQDAGVLITVSDTGCGIPAETAGRVFDPFFTTKPVGRGTGQGLAIAHTIIVERHGGAISFEPNSDGGTTFRIMLPQHDLAHDRDSLETAA
jgi:PAS domain S-box-containing protein